jgi:hypothetical protein
MKTIILGSEGMGRIHVPIVGELWGKKVIEYLIRRLYSNINIVYKNNNDCNFIISSHFERNNPYWNYKKKKYMYWSGESYVPKTNENEIKSIYLLTFIIDKQNFLHIPYFLYSPHLYKQRKYINNKREYFLGYCSSNKVIEREKIFNLFVNKKGIEMCHSYGKCYGNYPKTNKRKIQNKWYGDDIIDKYSKYQFVIAMENTCKDGYITEKIINAFYSGAIPIYWGCNSINKYFNEKAFININNFNSFEDCVDYVINLTDEDINKMRNEPIYTNDELVNLLNDDYNNKNNNKILKTYLKKLKDFIECGLK